MITRLVGGGTSWLYLVINDIIIDACHQDDKEGLARLKRILKHGN